MIRLALLVFAAVTLMYIIGLDPLRPFTEEPEKGYIIPREVASCALEDQIHKYFRHADLPVPCHHQMKYMQMTGKPERYITR